MKSLSILPKLITFFLCINVTAQISSPNGNTNQTTNPSTGNVGIGTTSPLTKLHVNGHMMLNQGTIQKGGTPITNTTDLGFYSHLLGHWVRIVSNNAPIRFFTDIGNGGVGSDAKMSIEANGNIGIGTTSPLTKLHVNGRMMLNQGSIQKGGTPITNTTDLGLYSHLSGHWVRIVSNNAPIRFFTDIGNGGVGSDAKMSVEANGNIGIGTTDTKGFKLGVNGRIAANEIKVGTYPNWPDFVFENNYNLPTLKEVELQIKENGHLKNIPSAEDVKKEGFFLGDMDSKLLQKIEELMLYTIEQEKEIETSKKEFQTQKEINKKFEKELEKLKHENQVLKSLLERVKNIEEKIK